MSSMIAFTLIQAAFFVVITLYILGGWRRGREARREWRQVSGRILEFGLTHRSPRVRYEYETGGQRYEGEAIVVRGKGVTVRNGSLPSRTYLDDRGRARYVPGREVAVYVNPERPEESALYVGTIYRPWIPLSITLLLLGLAAFFRYGTPPKEGEFFGAVLFLAGAALTWFGSGEFLQRLRGRDFSSVQGRLLEARVEMQRQTYTPAVQYEYFVGGTRYVSGQIASGMGVQSTQREKVEATVAALLADPKLRVWYHPTAPWVCFLHRQSLSIIFFCLGFGLFCLIMGGRIVTSAK